MNKTAQSKSTTFSPFSLGKLQRSCACGNHTAQGGECAECAKKRMQKKLAIGAVNDPLEREADRVADQVLAASAQASLSSTASHIQRYASEANEEEADTAPESVHQVLEGSGKPLEPALSHDFGRRFGRDFSHVRVHTDASASQSAKEVNAEAYTVGHKIVFAQGRFQPGTDSGRRLLAHELAHVVQQGGGKPHADSAGSVAMMPSLTPAVPMLRAKPQKTAPAPKPAKPKIPQICGRNSRKVAGNAITKVTLDVGANTLKIEWSNPSTAPAASAGTHAISPGTSLCCVDCNDDKTSQTGGSLCTPKGGSWKVDHIGCALAGHPTAKNPTYFQRGGIAIHSGNTASPPRSHGCSRTSEEISEIIHDNVVPEQTDIESNGTWTSTKCYKTEAAETPVNRSGVCDGFKLKSKSKKKAAPKKDTPKAKPNVVDPKAVEPPSTPAPAPTPPVAQDQPVAEVLSDESDALDNVALGIIPDGPGPNNDPASHESLGEMPVSDLEPIDEGESNDKEGETALV